MKLVTFSTRRSTGLMISESVDAAELTTHAHYVCPRQYKANLPSLQPEGVILTSDFLPDTSLFSYTRQKLPTAKIVLCLLPDSIETVEDLWPKLDMLEFDALCLLEELTDCLINLQAGRFYASSLLKTLSTEPKKKGGLPGFSTLTRMEKQIINLMMEGLNGPHMATKLFVSPRTVHHHKEHIVQKLGVANKQGELMAFILQNLLVLKQLLEK